MFESIRVIVNKLSKEAHFLPVKTTYTTEEYVMLYIKEIVRLHGMPMLIKSDRGGYFTGNLLMLFQKSLGT